MESSTSSSTSDSNSDSIDSTIQSAAEKHLADVYALEFDVKPTQVLLTVVSNPKAEGGGGGGDGNGNDDSGIIVRQSFLGGVVGMPAENDSGGQSSIPTRSELDEITLKAFDIPGYGEYFLKALRDSDDPGLDGLLLVVAESVDWGDGYEYDDGPFDSDSTNLDASSSSSSNNGGGNGQVVIMGQSMNIWAIAAVAALGAMFLVIILCTSILYCDWRGRKRRREKKRAERTASRSAGLSSSSEPRATAGGDDGSGTGGKKNKKRRDLHVVVPTASGETEGCEISPTTTHSSSVGKGGGDGGGGVGTRPSFVSRLSSGSSSRMQPPERVVVVTKKYRGSNASSSSSRGRNERHKGRQEQSQSPPGDDSYYYRTEDGNGNGNINVNVDVSDNNIGDVVATDVEAGDGFPSGGGGAGGGDDAYSVGEDTAMMLYPNINRNRGHSRDYGPGEGYASDDFDGYSIDGMSAMGDGGVSQFGGSGGGSGPWGGVGGTAVAKKPVVAGGSSRDVYYGGDVPRDFDSVWGDDTDDDEGSRMSRLASTADNRAYADLNNNLNRLVEAHEIEEGSQSGIGSVDSSSETSGSNVAGAFTLELLGKGIRATNRKIKLQKTASTGDSAGTPLCTDDDDSILGGMYRDDDDYEEEVGSASSAAGCTPGVGPPNTSIRLGLGTNDDDLSAIVVLDADDDVSNLGVLGGGEGGRGGEGGGGADEIVVPSGGGSVGSEPSWAAPIQSALQRSVKSVFRTTSTSQTSSQEAEWEASASATPVSNVPGKVKSIFLDKEKQQEQRTNEKFVLSLMNNDESSVGSNRSRGSHCSNKSTGSSRSGKRGAGVGAATTKKMVDETTAKSSNDKALGMTNSVDEEVDEDPATMIDNINNMLSECREILDTENPGVVA
jgi:hypothetical protein